MSSILDALKKAERESAVDGGLGSPWPASPVDSPVDGKGRWRLWMPLGVIAVLCVITSVVWLTLRPGPDRSDKPPVVTKGAVEPVETEMPGPAVLPAQKTPPPSRRKTAKVPSSSSSARLQQKMPLPAVTPDASPKKPPPGGERKPVVTPESSPQPTAPPPAKPTRRAVEMASAPQPSEVTRQETQKVFRSDERIDLQALVWAPESADRFVVINNRLLKEGGSVDKITVVRINQDEVLLSEGADQWFQEFKIR